jgi:hypothetical protein
LTDEQVRERLLESWPKVLERHARLEQPWTPEAGSALAEDDAAAPFSPWSSALARTSVSIATENYMVAACWLLNFGPPIFSMQPMLRTALIGGSQAVWMLSLDDQKTRLEHAENVSRDGYWNQHMFVSGLENAAPESYDGEQIADVRETLHGLVGGQRRPVLNYTQMIGAAMDHIYSSPHDPTIRASALATWRILSCVSHALPWETDTRSDRTSVENGGVRMAATRSSWSNLQEALSLGWAAIDVGWRLLDQRGALPRT